MQIETIPPNVLLYAPETDVKTVQLPVKTNVIAVKPRRKPTTPTTTSTELAPLIIPTTTTEKQKRVVTVVQRWMFSSIQLSFDKQIEYIQQIHDKTIPEENKYICKIIIQQIQHKLYGYKSQDILKGLYLSEKIIDVERTIEKLKNCENRCFYCNCDVHVLYEYVREPRQWTLERIENKFGHNHDNVVIACLHCNLHRKTMYHERYLFTKQLDVRKSA